MYQDVSRIRSKKSIYLDEYEDAVITALANYMGISKCALMREMMMKEARELLGVSDKPSVGQSAG